MSVRTTVAALAIASAATLAQAEGVSLVGQWVFADEGAGPFSCAANGTFVWSNGASINTGTRLFDPAAQTVGMILDPAAGNDDQAIGKKSENGPLEFSVVQVGRQAMETHSVATDSLVKQWPVRNVTADSTLRPLYLTA